MSEASVYRILKSYDLITSPAFIVLKAADEFQHKTTAINQLWQTDFTYLKVIGWGWFYLSTVLDDYSRYIIAWKLCTTMKAADVTDTLDVSGCNRARVVQNPRLLSDNGSSYVAVDLADYLEGKGIDHVRGAPHHPQTQGNIERWHQTIKNRVLLENHFLPGDMERQIGAFVDPAQAKLAAQRLANSGLPTKMGDRTRGGKAYTIVVVGPYQTQGALDGGLAKVRGMGYVQATLKR